MSEIPTGWMSADEARKLARRGVWAYRHVKGCYSYTRVCDSVKDALASIEDGEMWRFLCAHPDDIDAPAPVAVETVERWISVSSQRSACMYDTQDRALRDAAMHHKFNSADAHVVRVLLPLPTRTEPITVRGEVKP